MKESVNELDVKRDRLYAILDELDSVAVAYSGGVDSTCLLAACLEVLGPGKVLAMTADSPTYPAGEKARAQRVAQQLGARLRMINTRELDDPRFASNSPDRCYYCRAELFEKIWAIAREEGLQNVVYGATQDDLGDDRPSMRAAEERSARAPLLEAGLGKCDVRELSRRMGLPTWDKPALACLASRGYRRPFQSRLLRRNCGKRYRPRWISYLSLVRGR